MNRLLKRLGWINLVTILLFLGAAACLWVESRGGPDWFGDVGALWLLIASIAWSTIFMLIDVNRSNSK